MPYTQEQIDQLQLEQLEQQEKDYNDYIISLYEETLICGCYYDCPH